MKEKGSSVRIRFKMHRWVKRGELKEIEIDLPEKDLLVLRKEYQLKHEKNPIFLYNLSQLSQMFGNLQAETDNHLGHSIIILCNR